jgi:hypothetical protein
MVRVGEGVSEAWRSGSAFMWAFPTVLCLINNELYFYLSFVITFDLPLVPF